MSHQTPNTRQLTPQAGVGVGVGVEAHRLQFIARSVDEELRPGEPGTEEHMIRGVSPVLLDRLGESGFGRI